MQQIVYGWYKEKPTLKVRFSQLFSKVVCFLVDNEQINLCRASSMYSMVRMLLGS